MHRPPRNWWEFWQDVATIGNVLWAIVFLLMLACLVGAGVMLALGVHFPFDGR